MFIIVMFVSYFVISGMKFVEKMLKNSVDLEYLDILLCMYLVSDWFNLRIVCSVVYYYLFAVLFQCCWRVRCCSGPIGLF